MDKEKKYWVAAASHRLTRPNRSSAVFFFNGTSTQPELQIDIGPDGIGALCVADIDMDGDQDLFVGSTSPYNRYPEPADSQIWLNQNGTLKKVVNRVRFSKKLAMSMRPYFLTLREMISRIWRLLQNGALLRCFKTRQQGLSTEAARWGSTHKQGDGRLLLLGILIMMAGWILSLATKD
ncbi:hypothetical protein OAH23_07140 [Verrucomicrobia bacterium]|nr:hypothetical protein [Verrucomicrobiota bacterium]